MGKFETDWILDTAGARTAVAGLISDIDKYDTTVTKANERAQDGLERAAGAAGKFASSLADGTKIYRQIEDSAKSYEAEVKRLTGVYGQLLGQQKKVADGGPEYVKLQGYIAQVKDRITELGGKFNSSGNDAADFDETLKDIVADFDRTEREAKQTQAELGKLGQVYKTLTAEQAKFVRGTDGFNELQGKIDKVTARAKELGADLNAPADAVSNVAETAGEAAEGAGKKFDLLGTIGSKLGGIFAAVFAVGAIVSFGQKVLEVTSTFQKFEAVLTNTLGSNSKANAALAMIQDFAATTNFSVQEATESFIKFANRGIKLTAEQMTALADVANSTGKSLDQLTEAVLDSMTGENERLKEFGITAQKNGATTAFTFKGVTTEVKNTSAEITKYLVGLGKIQGVTGSTAAISETLGGKISNLGDTFDKLLLTIGRSSSAVFGAFIDGARAAINFVTELIGAGNGQVEQLQKEQIRVEALRIEINGLNVGNARRTELIKQLQQEYPGFLKNIDAEKVSNEELSAAIDKVSESLAGRILVQRKQDEIAKQAEKTADALQAKLEAEAAIRKSLAQLTIEQRTNAERGVKAARAFDEATGTEAQGKGIPIPKLTQGVTLAVAGEQVITAFRQQRLELNANSLAVGDLDRNLNKLTKAQKALDEQTKVANGLARQRADLVKGLFGSEKDLTNLTADAADKAKALTKAQLAQIAEYRRLVDSERGTDTALTLAEQKKLNAALLAEAKRAEKARIDALKELHKTLADLEKQAAKARLDNLQKDSIEYLDELRRQAMAEIDLLQKKVIDQEKAYKAKGGKGASADGKLSIEQEQDFNTLRIAVNANYIDAVDALLTKQQQAQFDAQATADEKILAEIERRYDKEILAAKKAHNEILADALEAKKAEEVALATRAQAAKKIDERQAIKTAVVESQDTSRTGIANLYNLKDGVDTAELDKRVLDAEKAKQQALLDIGIEFAKKRIELFTGAADQEGQLAELAAERQINELKDQKAKLSKDKSFTDRIKDFDLLRMLGVAEGDREAVKEAFSETLGYIQEFTQGQLDAANAVVEQSKDNVSEKQNDLNTEIELNRQGFASNVETKRAELAEAKKQRAEALADQKKAQQAQIALDTVTQTIALITSSINIIEGFSKIPIIGLPLGIAAVAGLFAAFGSAKSKALGAAKFAEGGKVGGKKHSEGGNKYISYDGNDPDVIEIERGEQIIKASSADKYEGLLDAINRDDRKGIVDYMLTELLAGTGVVVKPDLPERLRETHTELVTVEKQIAAQAYNPKDLALLNEHLAGIRQNTQPAPQVYEVGGNKVIVTGNKTRTIFK
jgi:hypothetical protein